MSESKIAIEAGEAALNSNGSLTATAPTGEKSRFFKDLGAELSPPRIVASLILTAVGAGAAKGVQFANRKWVTPYRVSKWIEKFPPITVEAMCIAKGLAVNSVDAAYLVAQALVEKRMRVPARYAEYAVAVTPPQENQPSAQQPEQSQATAS